ncbi:MAG: ABC transporter ATP-binding protein [Wenzhouxiangella sp.]
MHFGLLMVLMMVGAVAELITIGAVIPFIALLANPERAMEFELLQRFFAAFGWTQPDALVLPMTILFVVIVIISSAIRLLLTWAKNRFSYGLGYDIGIQLYSKVLFQPYNWHIARNTSNTIAAVNKVQVVVNGVLKPIMEAISGAVTGLAIIILLLAIEPLAAITAAAVFGAFYLLVVRLMRLRLRRNSKIIAEAQTARIKAVQEGLGGIRDVLLDSSQLFYNKLYQKVDQRLRTAQSANAFIGAAPRFIIEPIGIVLIVALAFYLSNAPGGLMAALPTLGALALGAQRLLPLLQQLYSGWSKVMGNRQNFADVLEYLELSPPSRSPNDQSNNVLFNDNIRLENLRFRYQDNTPWVLDSINLNIPRGARVGIAGITGSGKTTLMDVLMGLLEPVEGRMLIDDQALCGDNRKAWQQRVAHVPQFIFLADASIAENIAFGVPKHQIDMDRVHESARRAQIADFIESREGGYAARVGERGIQLSGGQRQRLGIARALYKNAEVLVFDEATSALDDQTEKAVMAAVETLDKDLTILLIAHRLTTLRSCDRIVVLREGRIEKLGSYQEIFDPDPQTAEAEQGAEESRKQKPMAASGF